MIDTTTANVYCEAMINYLAPTGMVGVRQTILDARSVAEQDNGDATWNRV